MCDVKRINAPHAAKHAARAMAQWLSVASVVWVWPVHAEWQPLSQTPQAQHFYDDAVQVQGQQISVWRITDFTQPLTNLEGKEVLSEKTFATIDCSSEKIAYSQVSRFAELRAKGEVRNHYETPLRFTRVAPDSADALLVKKVCPSK
jgi:hypothetical protein